MQSADEDCDIFRLAYTGDDLYDYLNDAIAEFYLVNKEPIIYEKKILFVDNILSNMANFLFYRCCLNCSTIY